MVFICFPPFVIREMILSCPVQKRNCRILFKKAETGMKLAGICIFIKIETVYYQVKKGQALGIKTTVITRRKHHA